MTGSLLLALGLAVGGLAGSPAHHHQPKTRKAYVLITSTDETLSSLGAPIVLLVHSFDKKHSSTTTKDILAPFAGTIKVKGDTQLEALDASAAAPYSTLDMKVGWSPTNEVQVSGRYAVSAMTLGLTKPWRSITPITPTTTTTTPPATTATTVPPTTTTSPPTTAPVDAPNGGPPDLANPPTYEWPGGASNPCNGPDWSQYGDCTPGGGTNGGTS